MQLVMYYTLTYAKVATNEQKWPLMSKTAKYKPMNKADLLYTVLKNDKENQRRKWIM
jgi:hypothetical protein